MTITQHPVPQDAFMFQFVDAEATYTDCFKTTVSGTITLPQLIRAFYNSAVFRPERWLLRVPFGRSSSRSGVDALANGAATFAAWRVEARDADQILLGDAAGVTKSWLCARSNSDGGTDVFFGSVVLPHGDPPRLGKLVHALMGFHVVYSRALLAGARRRLLAG